MTRSEKVKFIIVATLDMCDAVVLDEIGYINIQVETKRPYTFVRVSGEFVNGRGFSKCSAPDKWDAVDGLKIAAKRAARDYVDNVDKWENLTDGE